MIAKHRITPDDLLSLIESLINGTIDDADFARLEQILEEDHGARMVYRRYMNMHAAIPGLVGDQPRLTMRLSGMSGDEVQIDPADSAVVEALAELAKLHDEGLKQKVELDARHRLRDRSVDRVSRSTRIKARLVIGGGLAAVLALGVAVALLVMVLAKPSQPVAEQPQPESELPLVVATLTGTVDARWADTDGKEIELIVGDTLHPGRNLMLLDGIAELTTGSGAVATLEGPCEIELIENDNALRLHAGKLVGLVETQEAEGFTVYAPHMDVTDLGTRFGVDASLPGATEVHVFEGFVQVAMTDSGGQVLETRDLMSGTAMRAGDALDTLVLIDSNPERFKASAERVAVLPGTGLNQVEGDIDPNWRVVAVDGQPVTEHGGLIVVPNHHGVKTDPATSQWLKVNAALNPPNARSAVFTCRTRFDLPEGYAPEDASMVIRCKADHSIKALRVNGRAVHVPSNRISEGSQLMRLVFDGPLKAGGNTVEIDVYEVFGKERNSSSLRVEMEVHGR